MKLPQVKPGNKPKVLGLAYVIFSVLYLFASHVHISAPTMLPLTQLDHAIHFIDWTIFVYISQLGIICSPFFFHEDYLAMTRTLYAMLTATIIAFVIFMLYPTTLPRDNLTPRPWLSGLYSQLHGLDRPVNCFPSLHVALAQLAWTTYLGTSKAKLFFVALWASAITLSTVTTKQHYVIDVIGGLALASASFFIGRHLLMGQLLTTSSGPNQSDKEVL